VKQHKPESYTVFINRKLDIKYLLLLYSNCITVSQNNFSGKLSRRTVFNDVAVVVVCSYTEVSPLELLKVKTLRPPY